jgi:hypothetical protein
VSLPVKKTFSVLLLPTDFFSQADAINAAGMITVKNAVCHVCTWRVSHQKKARKMAEIALMIGTRWGFTGKVQWNFQLNGENVWQVLGHSD